METVGYDPFTPGHYPVGVRTIQAPDVARNRLLPCEIWYPAHIREAARLAGVKERRDAVACPGTFQLIVFSHSSGGNRRSSTILCMHLASHGYVVAALDHSATTRDALRPDHIQSCTI